MHPLPAPHIDAGAGTPLTPLQQRFNGLVDEVSAARAALAEWKQRLDRYEQAVAPLRRQLHDAFRQWVRALDDAMLQPGFSRHERAQLGEMLRETASALLEADPRDAEIAAVLARHAGDPVVDSADEEEAPATEAEDAWDWEAQAEAAAARREAAAASRRAARLQRRRGAQVQEASQSVREVYRRLASALHPDREPDPAQRERKTALMQQANQAHADGNLLALLELQLQAEQVAPSSDDRRLRHYVEVLEGQLAELRAESRRCEDAFRAAAGLPAGTGLQPRKFERAVSADVQRLRDDLPAIAWQVRLLADVDATRDWLRALRR